MVYNQILFNSFLQAHFSPKERSLQGWIVILGFVLLTIACYFVGFAAMLRLIYPAAAFVVAVFLYLRHPILYIGFTWWIWFLTPLVVRLVDYRVGWDPTRQMLIAPYLVVFRQYSHLFTILSYCCSSGRLAFYFGCFRGILWLFGRYDL